ncbi:hypothetical protein C1H46_006858 [Malus baccata]|uniref:RPW8 domain-containing protein n=1 Tax=Malus baccata TaxID=106549 RepID=A0A540N906_MALBA|nr:hypothetical protein C1H46_006858 [Malus baccata]
MVNGVDIAVGGVSGAAFGWIFDGITEVFQNAAEYTASHTNIKSTLKALEPLVDEMKKKNTKLHLPDEELKGLKEEMEKDGKRLDELSEQSVRNYFMRPFDNMELDGMNKSLQRLLGILQVQTGRDVKEVLVQVNDCKTDVNKISIQLDDCKTEIVKGISAWNGKTTDQLGEVASNGKETLDLTRRMFDRFERINGFSGFVPISEKVASWAEEEALGSSLVTMGLTIDEALSKPNPRFFELERLKERIKMFWEAVPFRKSELDMGFDEVKRLRIKVEEGTELIRKCSNVVEWTDHKMVKYANKLDELDKFLEAFVQRLKRTNITKPKGFDTQNSILCIQSSIGIC